MMTDERIFIKILGSGDSTGVPMILNHYGRDQITKTEINKYEDKNHRMRSSFILKTQNKNLLVECGPDIRQQTIKYNITEPFDAVFISHEHSDHCIGFWEIEHIAKAFNKKIKVYCSDKTRSALKSKFNWIFEKESPYFDFISIKSNQIVDDLTIIDVIHTPDLHAQGFRYKDFVFTPDMSILPEESIKHIKNANLWLLQCNSLYESEYVKRFHTSLPRAIKMIEELRPKQAILTHLSSEIDYTTISKILSNNIKLAYDGMEIFI
jgi:phosphoribosyl 1,2-cyclic phosphate phosphodiesterase